MPQVIRAVTRPSRAGSVMRSRDAGATWQNLGLPVQPNSAGWAVSLPASVPDTVRAASRYGYLDRMDDGGESWPKLWREFGEVSSIPLDATARVTTTRRIHHEKA